MRIAFYGSSILSSYWNGAATYYRGLLSAMAHRGHDISFFEPDAFGRQERRDIEPPDWCRTIVYDASPDGLNQALRKAREADIVVKASGVGYADDELLAGVLRETREDAVTIWWDVDAPATLAEIEAASDHPLRRAVRAVDLVLTYGGGPPVVAAYQRLGAALCVPIYNALDTLTHHPVPPDPRFEASLAFLGNRLPDREERVEEFFLEPAELLPEHSFLLGGAGWDDKPLTPNMRWIGHVSTAAHNAFNASPLAVLNVNRESMARTGYSPPTRIFEAAGAGACVITDAWTGIEQFLAPGEEVLVARDGRDVADILRGLDVETARRIGEAGRARLVREHTYRSRAVELDALLLDALARKRAELAA
jgi:spore maturation protein CgeB